MIDTGLMTRENVVLDIMIYRYLKGEKNTKEDILETLSKWEGKLYLTIDTKKLLYR